MMAYSPTTRLRPHRSAFQSHDSGLDRPARGIERIAPNWPGVFSQGITGPNAECCQHWTSPCRLGAGHQRRRGQRSVAGGIAGCFTTGLVGGLHELPHASCDFYHIRMFGGWLTVARRRVSATAHGEICWSGFDNEWASQPYAGLAGYCCRAAQSGGQ